MLSSSQTSAMLADVCQVLYGPDANGKPFGDDAPYLLSYNHCMWACAIRPNPNPVSWLQSWADNHPEEASKTQVDEWHKFLENLKGKK